MNYIVRVLYTQKGKRTHLDYHEFNTEEDANDYADWKASEFRKNGYEFAVDVYKRIG